MDVVDFAIFRSLCVKGGGARFYGARTVMDPRISAREVAESVGISPSAVRTRLARWQTEGLLKGYEVWPNPDLFGVHLMSVEIPLEGTHPASAVFDELKLVDGVLFARDAIDEDRRVVIVNFVHDTPIGTERRVRLIARLSPRKSVDPPRPAWLPPSTASLSPLDWRIVRAFRRNPLLPLPQAAREVGVSLKTIGHRYHRLLDHDAAWWTISVSNSMVPAVYVHIAFEDASSAETAAASLGAQFPGWIPARSGGFGFPPEPQPKNLVAVFPLAAPSGVNDILRAIHGLPGVVSVRRRFPGDTACYREWFDARIEDQIVG
jgi:DNA-binding Lrp family transcriptional regulator